MASFDAAGEKAARAVFAKLRVNLLAQNDRLLAGGIIRLFQHAADRQAILDATDFDQLASKKKKGRRLKLNFRDGRLVWVEPPETPGATAENKGNIVF